VFFTLRMRRRKSKTFAIVSSQLSVSKLSFQPSVASEYVLTDN